MASMSSVLPTEDDRKSLENFTKIIAVYLSSQSKDSQTATGTPHSTNFSFIGDEIPKLLEFISNLRAVHFPNDECLNVTDAQLQRMILSSDQARALIVQNQDIVLQLAAS